MNIEKLIERMNNHLQSLATYSDPGLAHTLEDAATALSTLQAENEKLRAELEYEKEHANAYYEECGQWEAENEKLRVLAELGNTRAKDYRVMRDRAVKAEEENKKLRAELEQVKAALRREQDEQTKP